MSFRLDCMKSKWEDCGIMRFAATSICGYHVCWLRGHLYASVFVNIDKIHF